MPAPKQHTGKKGLPANIPQVWDRNCFCLRAFTVHYLLVILFWGCFIVAHILEMVDLGVHASGKDAKLFMHGIVDPTTRANADHDVALMRLKLFGNRIMHIYIGLLGIFMERQIMHQYIYLRIFLLPLYVLAAMVVFPNFEASNAGDAEKIFALIAVIAAVLCVISHFFLTFTSVRMTANEYAKYIAEKNQKAMKDAKKKEAKMINAAKKNTQAVAKDAQANQKNGMKQIKGYTEGGHYAANLSESDYCVDSKTSLMINANNSPQDNSPEHEEDSVVTGSTGLSSRFLMGSVGVEEARDRV